MGNVCVNFRNILLILKSSFVVILAFNFTHDNDTDIIGSDIEDRKAIIIFQTLFLRKRIQQIDAVKNILNFKYETKYDIMLKTLEKAFEAMTLNRAIIENSHYIPGFSLPKDDIVIDALHQILDNTAMFGEFQLKVPDITDRIMGQHSDWTVLIQWAIGFANSTGLYDGKTNQLINLVAQEMNLVERESSYFNPYRTENLVSTDSHEKIIQSQKKKEKSKKTKGPRMTKPQRSDL